MLIMGLGMVFFGLQLMANGVEPLRYNPDFIALLSRFTPVDYFGVIKCVIIGSIVTATIQSSSATVAITITLARTGVIDFDTSVALVLGQNIGTTITAFLGSLGMNINARRVAYAHILIKIVGVVLIIPFFFLYMSFLKWIINENADIATQIALAHTIFNVILVLAFLPFTRMISSLLFHIFKPRETDSMAPALTSLDIRMLDSPMISIEQSRKEVLRMGQIAGTMMASLRDILNEESTDKLRISILFNQEEELDMMQKEVVIFLTHLLTLETTTAVSKEAHEQLRRADEYESMSDYVTSILKIHLRLKNAGLSLDEDEKNDVLSLHDSVYEFYQLVYEAHTKKDTGILSRARPRGEAITFQFREIRSRHMTKLSEKQLAPLICTLYPDLLAGYRRIKEHLFNIAEAVAGEK
jgi:phosphate:Na+ symporter